MSARIRVLLVEDSEDDAELIVRALERRGFELDWCRVDTEPAFVGALAEPWHLILSDFQMPDFSGLRAFALYKEHEIDTPFIFVSGALGEERAVEAMRAGARDYLLKGNLMRLGAAVERELRHAEARREHRLASEQARRDQERLALAVEASRAGVFEQALARGAVGHCSERFGEIFGVEAGAVPTDDRLLEWLGQRAHADDVGGLRRVWDVVVAAASPALHVEARFRHEGGHWLHVALSGKALERAHDGGAARIVGVAIDVTERRKLEQQFLQAQKMDAVGRLAGGVAHDFNNLLTAILSFGSFVLEELHPDEPAHADMSEVLAAARRAEALTAQLLAFSRRRPVSPRVVSVTSVVEGMGRMLGRLVGEDVDVTTRLAPDLWNVRVDPGSLEQVVLNLVVNARDAMPDGGKLSIETFNTKLGREFGIERGVDVPAGDYVALVVSDEGVGMDEETRRRLFEPFFTTKGPGKGTGLGLSTCYGIVKQASGFIWAYSEPGMGSSFKVFLPRVVAESDVEPPKRAPEADAGDETILVAEDDAQVRALAVRALSRLGYKTLEAANGGEALLRCERWAGPIHLLLTDVVMPEMSGRQLAERLLALRPDMRVVYMSGYTENAIVNRGVVEPGVRLLQKPFTPDVLVAAVREALDS